MKRIDLASWNRNEHFQFFSAFDEPFFSLVSEINSSKAFEKSKTDKPSFFARYLHASIRTVNEIPEFKFRIHEDRVVQFDTINASPTLGRPDGTFGFGFIPYTEDLQDFARALALDSERVRNSSGLGVSPNTSRQDVEKWTPSLGQ
ncbi:MAG: chloramphenicol acetyltransferase, partial [Candidatus Marinimicrobia bacterium]|nr:chloramphenicol acetyltransferase [Candidatus Neomarinimicrobiota bacterium]